MIVSNATPLIYLAKIGKLDLLKELYDIVLITEEVKKEIVDKGKELNKKDAYVIEAAIQEGWIRVEKAKEITLPIELETGERSTINLAKGKNIREVIIDEVSARTAARLVGLTPRGTIFVLLRALEKKLINYNEFLEILNKLIEEGFRLKEEIYVQAIEKARGIK